MSVVTNIVHQMVAKKAFPLRTAGDELGDRAPLILGFVKRSKRFSAAVYSINSRMNEVRATFADPSSANNSNTNENSALEIVATEALKAYMARNEGRRPEFFVIFRKRFRARNLWSRKDNI